MEACNDQYRRNPKVCKTLSTFVLAALLLQVMDDFYKFATGPEVRRNACALVCSSSCMRDLQPTSASGKGQSLLPPLTAMGCAAGGGRGVGSRRRGEGCRRVTVALARALASVDMTSRHDSVCACGGCQCRCSSWPCRWYLSRSSAKWAGPRRACRRGQT
eukprot:6214697-Pleurochrysis_carterae.AAC.3